MGEASKIRTNGESSLAKLAIMLRERFYTIFDAVVMKQYTSSLFQPILRLTRETFS